MRKRQQRAQVILDVEELQDELDKVFYLTDEFARSLALEGAARQRLGEIYSELRSRLQPAALRIEQLRDHYAPGNRLSADVLLRGSVAVVFMAKQVVALDIATEAMVRFPATDDEDELLVRAVIERCAEAIESHASMVRSVMRATPTAVLSISQIYDSDLDGASAAFDQMVREFNEFKERMEPA